MSGSTKRRLGLAIGLFLSAACIWLAFRNVDLGQMGHAFMEANYLYVVPAVVLVFFSHYLRALRWRILLDPMRRVDTPSLFSALLIGYAANTFMPAHLGEFLRAYVLGRKRGISKGAVFATIVVERVIDVFSMLALLVAALFLHPFPEVVIQGGYIMLAVALGILVLMVFLKKATVPTMKLLRWGFRPLPDRIGGRLCVVLERFITGLVPLKRKGDYLLVAFLSLLIWACYGLILHLCLLAFGFVGAYELEWSAALIILVITTIAIVVPSSPGYVGTYHYLCQMSLALYGIPGGPALSFATVAHAVNFLPVLVVGLLIAQFEGMAIMKISKEEEVETAVGETLIDEQLGKGASP